MTRPLYKVRIGNDVPFEWRIVCNGEEVDLEGKDLRVSMIRPNGSRLVMPHEVEGNVVKWTLRGVDQHELGEYYVSLWENYGKPGQSVVDSGAVEIVAASCVAGNACVEHNDPVELGPSDLTLGNVVSIREAEQVVKSEETGGENVLRITLSSGRTVCMVVRNGGKGGEGKPGSPGKDLVWEDLTDSQKQYIYRQVTSMVEEGTRVAQIIGEKLDAHPKIEELKKKAEEAGASAKASELAAKEAEAQAVTAGNQAVAAVAKSDAAAKSAGDAAATGYAIKKMLDQFAASGDINETAVAKIAEHEGKLTDLFLELDNVPTCEGNRENEPFAIADENGYVIISFNNGHFKTSKFDSKEVLTNVENINRQINTFVETTQEDSFALADENGNALVKFINGHVVTKNFDSRTVPSSASAGAFYGYIFKANGILLVRDNCRIDNGDYVNSNDKYCSNKIGCKNSKVIEIVGDGIMKVVLFKSDNTFIETSSIIIESNKKYEYFVIESTNQDCSISIYYDKEEDVEMTDYPLYYRVPINQRRYNLAQGVSANQLDEELLDYPLAALHFAKGFPSVKKCVLLNGGFGKVLTIDGWKSSTTGWENLIGSLQEEGVNVIAVEGGRKITSQDIYRSEVGAYVMPSLGNPLIFQALKAAHGFAVSKLNVNENVGLIGASQGGILAYNYHNLNGGNVSCIVVLAGLSRLKEDGWDRQDASVRRYFDEWYGITDYDKDVVKAFDPSNKIITINDKKMLLGHPPIKCIYGSSDTTALAEPAKNIVDAINNANGLAVMRIITNGTHSSVAGATDDVVINETICWIKRFL